MVGLNLKTGTKCKVVSNTSGHNQPIGTIVTIRGNHGNNGYSVNECGSWFAYTDLSLVSKTSKELDEELSELTSRIEIVKSKILYLKDNNLDEVKYEEFREYQMNRIISSKLSTEDKVKKLLALEEIED